jgi:hypothetical protein
VKAPADQLDGHVSLLWDFRSTDAHERRRWSRGNEGGRCSVAAS